MKEFLYVAFRPVVQPLWCMMAWFVAVVALTANVVNVPTSAWVSAVIMCLIVGSVLNVNAFASQGAQALLPWARDRPLTVLRFYAIPLCISSYSATVAHAEPTVFWYVFPREAGTLGAACGCVGGTLAFVVAIRLMLRDETSSLLGESESTQV